MGRLGKIRDKVKDKVQTIRDSRLNRRERALIIVSVLNTDDNEKAATKWLYKFIEANGISLAFAQLGAFYKKRVSLKDDLATKENLIETLQQVARDSKIQEIDVLLHCHGNDERLYLYEERVTSQELAKAIGQLRIGHRLRMLYSTACYGASHADDFVMHAGFTCASGAKGINYNSATEYPEFLSRWNSGESFGSAIAKSRNKNLDGPFKRIATRMFPNDVIDSDKVVYGNKNANFHTVAG